MYHPAPSIESSSESFIKSNLLLEHTCAWPKSCSNRVIKYMGDERLTATKIQLVIASPHWSKGISFPMETFDRTNELTKSRISELYDLENTYLKVLEIKINKIISTR